MRNLNEETKAALEGIKREQISKNRASADDIADLCQQAEYLAVAFLPSDFSLSLISRIRLNS